jgi:hypothetical protein
MKLRDHPLMSYRGLTNWPPVWTRARGNVVKTVRGEVGILAYVHCNAQSSSRCYLIMDYEGETYVGTLIFGDQAFCTQITDLLRLHLKRSIKEIGDLELSHTL